MVGDVIDTIHKKMKAYTKIVHNLDKGMKDDDLRSSTKSEHQNTPETIHTKLRSSHMRSANKKKRDSDQIQASYRSGQFGVEKVLTPIKEGQMYDITGQDQTKYYENS